MINNNFMHKYHNLPKKIHLFFGLIFFMKLCFNSATFFNISSAHCNPLHRLDFVQFVHTLDRPHHDPSERTRIRSSP